jgi:2-phosphosulfolactate phosphatase
MAAPIRVHLWPAQFRPEVLRDGVAIVIDLLRASTTIATALANGAAGVVPCESIDEAKGVAAGKPGALLGGEREGTRVPGFDLGNSPREYGAETVRGRTIVFTTTNGTRAIRRSLQADDVIVGALVNLGAVAQEAACDARPVHLVCAGLHGAEALEDTICAGAFLAELTRLGLAPSGDAAQMALKAWSAASGTAESLAAALRTSPGGRALVEIGLDADIESASRISILATVPALNPVSGRLVALSRPANRSGSPA